MKQILDLHIHSKYSRACSRNLVLPEIAKACEIRGIDIVATGDFTHPAWFKHLQENLIEENEGVYKLKDDSSKTRFIIGTELSSIKKHKGQTRRIHLCLFAPNLEAAEKFNKKLEDSGFNIRSDGRPILGLTSKEILELALGIDERMFLVPAHVWTPWFGIFGSKGGYNSLEDAFEDLTPYVRAVETGLSSDPLMNWQWSKLDNITLISNSDAHSPQKLGREANVFEFKNKNEITYSEIKRIIETGDRDKFLHTIEFYPEEGKYHVDGHRVCKFFCEPEETKKLKGICPVCKKPLVVGVLNRVSELADRNREEAKKIQDINPELTPRFGNEKEYFSFRSSASLIKRIPYKNIVPLPEILGDLFGVGVSSKKVQDEYKNLIEKIGNEFYILIDADIEQIKKLGGVAIAESIKKMREGNVFVRPGFDGEFGVVKIYGENNLKPGQSRLLV